MPEIRSLNLISSEPALLFFRDVSVLLAAIPGIVCLSAALAVRSHDKELRMNVTLARFVAISIAELAPYPRRSSSRQENTF
jgi:hypothetical protein